MGPRNASIAELMLNGANPRIAAARSEREALQKILEDQEDKLLALAQSIVADGLNPMDRLLVTLHAEFPGRLVVLEGNRRIAALKILANPTVLSDLNVRATLKKQFDKLARQFDRTSVEPIDCYEVEDPTIGSKWIRLRHTGENGGRGIVGWSGIARARFRNQDPALQVLEFVEKHGNLSTQELENIQAGFPITTLDRLLSSRDVRQKLGFEVRSGTVVSGLPPGELVKPFQHIVRDLLSKAINVSQLKNKAQQREYLDSLPRTAKPNQSKAGAARPIVDSRDGDVPSDPPKPKAAPRKAAAERPERTTLAPRRTKLDIPESHRARRIFVELTRLRVADTPNAAAVLFRVFLELSVDHLLDAAKLGATYKDPKSGRVVDKSLKSKVDETIAYLVKQGASERDYKAVARGVSVQKSPMSIELLNAYVHNRFTTPTTHDLLAAWNDAQPFFEAVWREAGR